MKPIAVALLAALVAGPVAAQQTETVTLDAYSLWSGTGSVLPVGPDSHGFAGEMRGMYFIDTGKGAIPAGEIACLGTLVADDRSGAQTGSALCRLTATDGAVAFARFACEGYRLVGCAGRFEITGGEGRMTGATGEGPIVIRRMGTTLTGDERGRVTESALAIVSWKGFSVSLPAQPQ
jgi:hypothetical protein